MAECESPVKENLEASPEDISETGLNVVDKPSDVSKSSKIEKIDILLKPTANAPIMKKKKWSVDPDKKIGMVIEFIKKYLKLDPAETLFLYVNQAFAPSPDQLVRNLYDCYETDGKLILHYCLGQAWG
ncbi:autophagy protein 12-like [Macrosteles quadrilineatus]|uniref:autophagy protein 12-like n=1 Tax=Macrosteles quadrilineatus TaxID=74068 RepID=UPI0023E182D0|nr:autophagy protein 12-like [Macrosteles quadrilineatus]XP_054290337.1 autophagy protein 12-like [Macrosteles quadrilineatus]